MNELLDVAAEAVEEPVAAPPSIAMLRAAWIGADASHGAAASRGIAATTCCLVVIVALVVQLGTDESSLSVVGPSPDTEAVTIEVEATPATVPAITDRSLYADPAPESDGFVLSPPGPYEAGQQISVTVDDPRGRWDPNGAARQCAVIDGTAEICDIRRKTYGYQKVIVRAEVLGPDGLIPCAAPSVTCRFAVGFEDTLGSVASAPIEVIGSDPPSGTITIEQAPPLAADGVIDVRIDGIVPRPESDALVEQLPAGEREQWQRLYPEICRFRLPTEPGYGLNPWDCGGTYDPGNLVLVPGGTSTSETIVVGRVFFGYGGWQDCGANRCVLVMRRNFVAGLSDPGVAGGTDEVAVTPLRFETDGAARALPTLTIEEVGPYDVDELVTVRGTGFPVQATVDLGRCVPDGKTSFLGSPQLQNCTYAGAFDVSVDADGSFVASVPLRCGAADGRCLLAWIPGEGSPPYASVEFELAP